MKDFFDFLCFLFPAILFITVASLIMNYFYSLNATLGAWA